MPTTEERIERLEKDMWFGNGKPGMVTRMANQEKSTERFEETLIKHDKKLDMNTRLLMIGFGIIATLQWIVPYILRRH